MFSRIKRFMGEARQELRHVNWPTREEAMRLTAIVIGISAGLALFLGLFDFIFAEAVKELVSGDGARVSPPHEAGEANGAGALLSPEDVEISTEEGELLELGEDVNIEVEPPGGQE